MCKKRTGNYKKRKPKGPEDHNRGTRDGFLDYYQLPENAILFRQVFKAEATIENINKAFDKTRL